MFLKLVEKLLLIINEKATQILTASADDNLPLIQVWDLRSPYTPLKV